MAGEIGVVCGRCDRYSPLGAKACSCGASLALRTGLDEARTEAETGPEELRAEAGISEPPPVIFGQDKLKPRKSPSGPERAATVAVSAQRGGSALSSSRGLDDEASLLVREAPQSRDHADPEELMEQAKNYVCRSCSTPVPLGHKFCGRCGAAIPPDILALRTQFFGQLQMPGKAKLILIRGDGIEGLSYQLNAEQHVVGRSGQIVFPDDPFVSPHHANLFYRGGKLVVRDEGSRNGVFWRVHGSVDITPGDQFLAGEQLFDVEGPPKTNDGPASDGTYFYSSPKHQAHFKIIQILERGALGMAVCARGRGLQIGREGGDLNFPGDLYMSAAHCKIEDTGAKLVLTDMTSRNGTYVKIRNEKELAHGDYVFIGRKLLRVEVTASN
jgi:pSer/pThr/pTyr-binding forkhead associated (FHA) protein